ncbi:MAG: hypothetical protein IJX14_04230, partial [Clostridia bacterium]|nr:hypothetical protein [Clostridia bacterium]
MKSVVRPADVFPDLFADISRLFSAFVLHNPGICAIIYSRIAANRGIHMTDFHSRSVCLLGAGV